MPWGGDGTGSEAVGPCESDTDGSSFGDGGDAAAPTDVVDEEARRSTSLIGMGVDDVRPEFSNHTPEAAEHTGIGARQGCLRTRLRCLWA